ncbi:MAG: hypothetical protein FWE84_04685 [Firmicutes bacterium]|nr:hypothetical protein [Bacillota bacterium]
MKRISKTVFISIAGAIVLLLQVFGLKIDAPYVNEIIEAVCAVLIVLGVVTAAKPKADEDEGEDSGGNAGKNGESVVSGHNLDNRKNDDKK